MKSLYELTQEELRLLAEMEALADPEPDPETGEIPDNTGKLGDLIKVQMQGEKKVESMIRVIEHFEHRAALADAEYKSKKEIIERARREARRCENAVKRIKDNILSRMEILGETEIQAGARRLKVVGTRGSVHVAPDAKFSLWPDHLYTVEYKPDRKAIYNEYNDSDEIPHGVEIIPGKRLAIK